MASVNKIRYLWHVVNKIRYLWHVDITFNIHESHTHLVKSRVTTLKQKI